MGAKSRRSDSISETACLGKKKKRKKRKSKQKNSTKDGNDAYSDDDDEDEEEEGEEGGEGGDGEDDDEEEEDNKPKPKTKRKPKDNKQLRAADPREKRKHGNKLRQEWSDEGAKAKAFSRILLKFGSDDSVRRCSLTVSKPLLKVPRFCA